MGDGRMFTEAGGKKHVVSVDMTAKKWGKQRNDMTAKKSLKTTSRDRVTGIFCCYSNTVKKY